MITEDYASFELAKLLKKKGFDIPVNYEYHYKITIPQFHKIKHNFNGIEYHNCSSEWYSAPTLQMTCKYLREKYNIYINIQPDFPSDKGYKICWCWSTSILHENCISVKGHQCYIETYEEAVEAALKYVLENLI